MTDGTRNHLLALLAKDRGESIDDMLEACALDSVVPGICVACEAITDDCEPDAEANHCTECKRPTVQSAMILANII